MLVGGVVLRNTKASQPNLLTLLLRASRTLGQTQLARVVLQLWLDLMHRVVTSEQIVADRYRVMESARCYKEQEDEHKACDYSLMVLLDGRGHGGHDGLPR